MSVNAYLRKLRFEEEPDYKVLRAYLADISETPAAPKQAAISHAALPAAPPHDVQRPLPAQQAAQHPVPPQQQQQQQPAIANGHRQPFAPQPRVWPQQMVHPAPITLQPPTQAPLAGSAYGQPRQPAMGNGHAWAAGHRHAHAAPQRAAGNHAPGSSGRPPPSQQAWTAPVPSAAMQPQQQQQHPQYAQPQQHQYAQPPQYWQGHPHQQQGLAPAPRQPSGEMPRQAHRSVASPPIVLQPLQRKRSLDAQFLEDLGQIGSAFEPEEDALHAAAAQQQTRAKRPHENGGLDQGAGALQNGEARPAKRSRLGSGGEAGSASASSSQQGLSTMSHMAAVVAQVPLNAVMHWLHCIRKVLTCMGAVQACQDKL